MGKPRAVIQRLYRERKKLNDPEYLVRERSRCRAKSVPVADQGQRRQDIVRKRNKTYSKTYRDLKKSVKHSPIASTSERVDVSTIGQKSRCSRSSTTRMLVKMTFPTRQHHVKRSRALRKANATICQLKSSIKNIQKNGLKWKKRAQRMAKKQETSRNVPATSSSQDQNGSVEDPITPLSKARRDLRRAGLSPSKVSKPIVRKLTMANAMLNEVKDAMSTNKKQKVRRAITAVISGKVVKRYKCMSELQKATGLSRYILKRPTSKVLDLASRARLTLIREELKKNVISFLERDDISIAMPGKNDVTKDGQAKRQTRVLNDYMSNVYDHFKADATNLKVSFSTFCKLRPKYIQLTSFISRNTCLCSKHQNMAMKLKCLQSLGAQISKSPNAVSQSTSIEDMNDILDNIKEDTIEFQQWKRVTDGEKKRMKIVTEKKSKAEFVSVMKTSYKEFLEHVDRVNAQYAALKELKEHLPQNHIILQMDFAENFSCACMDEIQSAYWNATSVTLHPVVAYYQSGTNELEHKSFVYVSDVNKHNSTAVLTIMKMLTKELRELLPEAEMVHYWTDSPSSQYRNRYIFDAVLRHTELSGLKARWNYFESGHGKGPCDGIGGSAKRQAADAIKQGKSNIQDAHEFYQWAVTNQKAISYRFYSEDEYNTTAKELSESTPAAVPGTMKIHAVCPQNGVLYTRDTSCYCANCLVGDLCDTWRLPGSNSCHTGPSVDADPEHERNRNICDCII